MAILLVLMVHAWGATPVFFRGFASQGWVGVDLFFVLSGFLITGILWDGRGSEGYFRRFYGRRILRIWPAYFVLLAFAFLILPLLKMSIGGALLDLPVEPLEVWPYLLMIQNLFANAVAASVVLSVTWSLAIEEQFYLIWPILIRFASHRAVLISLFIGFAFAPFLRSWAMQLGLPQIAIYMNPLTHGDGLLCGAAVATWLRLRAPSRNTLCLAGSALLAIGIGVYLPIRPDNPTGHYCSPFLYTAVSLICTGLLLLALVSEKTGYLLHRFFFMNRSLAFLGFISYGLYLCHSFILRFGLSEKLLVKLDRWRHPYLTHGLLACSALALSILVAWTSRITLERFALSYKRLFA